MGVYKLRDLGNLPSLISLSRVPLALAFVLFIERPNVALLVFVLGGLSDVVDGAIARARNQATAVGATVDPITDKLFVGTVVVTLVAYRLLEASDVLWLASREILEAPLVVWVAFHRDARRVRTDHPKANLWGKLATLLQFVTVASALMRWPATELLLLATGVVGASAGVVYWMREVTRYRAHREQRAR